MQEKNRDFSILKQRILQYLENKRIKKSEMYIKTGISQGVFSQSNALSEDNLLKFLNFYRDINPIWLLTGQGPMLKTENSKDILITKPPEYEITQVNESVFEYSSGKKIRILPVVLNQDQIEDNIPLVHTKAAAGYVQHLEEPEYVSNLPMFRLPGKDFTGASMRAFEIEGESMIPELHPGWIVVGRYVENWVTQIKDGRVYAVVPKSGRPVVKRLLNRIKKRGEIMLRSANAEYRTYPLLPEDISEVWEIKAFIGFEFPQNDRQLATDVNTLMADVAELQFVIQELQKKLK